MVANNDPLTYALCKHSEPWMARQARHLSYTAEFTSDILYVSGSENIVADILSRPAAMAPGTVDKGPTEVNVPFGYSVPHHCRAANSGDCSGFRGRFLLTRVPVQTLSRRCGLLPCGAVCPIGLCFCAVSRGTARLVILTQDRKLCFQPFHTLEHPGTRATRR